MRPKLVRPILLITAAFLLTACQFSQPAVTPTLLFPSPTPFQPLPLTPTRTPTPTDTPTTTPTPTSTATSTPTETPTPTDLPTSKPLPTEPPEEEEPTATIGDYGSVTVPILLYHHISDTVSTEYSVHTDQFKEQMKWLSDRGYTSVNISDVSRAIVAGEDLPDRPVVITFDDGYLDVYQNAYPILENYGFFATFFIIGDTVDTRGNLSAEQLQELVNHGWEIGCHSMHHSYLTSGYNLEEEIVGSKVLLESKIGDPVQTFAYPYGLTNATVTNYTINAGYTSAVGLGSIMTHSTSTLFFLHRKEIKSWYTLDFFDQFMPWK